MARITATELERENIAFANVSDSEILIILARRIRRLRIAANESQLEFSRRARIPLRTYKRFELTGKASLENFVQMLTALNCAQYIKHLLPVPPSMIESDPLSLEGSARLLELARDPNRPIRSV